MSDFKQAIQWLKEGKKVRRPSFSEDFYCILNDNLIKYVDENGNMMSSVIEFFEATDWEIYEEGYYECLYCHRSLEEKDMGLRCKYCNEWTYHKDCFKKGKKLEPKESLSENIFDSKGVLDGKIFVRDAKEKIQNAHRRLKEELKVHERVNPLIVKRIDKIFKEEFGPKLI